MAALAPFFGPPQATVFGRSERIDVLHAALMNGITSHTFDFDDTHLKTVIHPAGPVASALFALAEHLPVDGATLMHAFVLGVEVECRIGNAVYPSHYDVGWHITGTTGVFGSAAAAGKLLGLDEQQLVFALGIAATQSAGLREMFGSMCKPLHPGMAAKNGLYAALDGEERLHELAGRHRRQARLRERARDGRATTTRSPSGSARRGSCRSTPTSRSRAASSSIRSSTAASSCATSIGLTAGAIARIDLDVHPLVLELTGKTNPQVGLEGKFSVYHCAACAIIYGDGGEAQFSDARVREPAVIALRDRVKATADPVDPRGRLQHPHHAGRRHGARAPCRACDRQPRATDERRGPRGQVPRPVRGYPSCATGSMR